MHRCNNCNVRRTKCSGEQPCSQCVSSSRECVYPILTPKVSVSRGELEDLRRRVEAYDKVLQDVVPDPEKRRALLGSRGASETPTDSPGSSTMYSWQQPLSPGRTEVTTTTEDEQPQFSPIEGRLLHDGIGTARFHGEWSELAFVDNLKALLISLLPISEVNSIPTNIGRCQTSDSRPLPPTDANPLWLPPANATRTMLVLARSFIQDGTEESSSPSGGIYWWGDIRSQPPPPPSGGQIQVDRRSALRLAFYQTALAIACRIASTKPAAPGITPDRSEPFFSRASTLLGHPLDVSRCSIGEVSVLTLMVYYLLETDRHEAAAVYISLAARISISLGAQRGHVDERGRRVFWTLYLLDRWVSSILGRPPAISDDVIRLPLPVDSP